jgi:hypothetical protein
MMKRLALGLLLATAAWAESPFVGTWKLDSAKTKFTAGEPPREETIVVADAGDHATVTTTGTTASGRPISIRYSVPVKGGAVQIEESPCDAMTVTRTGANIADSVCTRRGRQIGTRHTVISDDGKTMTAIVHGINAQGRVAGVEIYEKQ